MDINQIVALLNQVTDAVHSLKIASTQTVSEDVDERTILLAKQYPIKGHYLVGKTDIVKKYYVGFLLAFCNSISDESLEQSKMYHICRIIASYDCNVNLKEYIAHSLKVDTNTIHNLIEVFDFEAVICFSVDLLILNKKWAKGKGLQIINQSLAKIKGI